MDSHPVVEGLRRASVKSRVAFLDELEGRIRQLVGNMVDGHVIPKDEVDGLRYAIIALVRSEVLPTLRTRPSDGLLLLDKLKAYGWTQLETERAPFVAARAAMFPPPAPLDWTELAELRATAEIAGPACVVAAPVGNAYFAKALEVSHAVRRPSRAATRSTSPCCAIATRRGGSSTITSTSPSRESLSTFARSWPSGSAE